MVSGAVIAVAFSLLLQDAVVAEALVLGAISGVFVSFGLTVLYRGMAQMSAAVVAPPASVFAALVPFVWDIQQGARPSGLAILGCVVAMAFLGLSTLTRPTASLSVTADGVPTGRTQFKLSLIHTPSPRDATLSRMPSSA